jgi:hypothetical protein
MAKISVIYTDSLGNTETVAKYDDELPVLRILDALKAYVLPYPAYPGYPPRLLGNKHTVQQAYEYAENLKAYEEEELQFKKKMNRIQEINGCIDQEMCKIAYAELEAREDLTVKQKHNVIKLAWDWGYASGISEVYGYVCDLLMLFDK